MFHSLQKDFDDCINILITHFFLYIFIRFNDFRIYFRCWGNQLDFSVNGNVSRRDFGNQSANIIL